MLKRFRRVLDRLMQGLLVFLLGVLVMDVLWQVFSRLVLRAPSSFTDELAGFLFIWVGLLGAAYAGGQGMHLSIDLLPSRLGPRAAQRLRLLADVLVIVFAVAILIIGGTRLVFITLTLHQLSPTMQIPLGYVYTAVPLCGVLMVLYAGLDIAGRRHPDDALGTAAAPQQD